MMLFVHLRHYFCFYLLAVTPLQANELRFTQLDSDDGLLQGTVTALAQDQYQLVWVGTEDGLARYDGHEFITYRSDPDDPTTIQDNVVTALAVDAANRLWVGSEFNGVSYYDYKNDQFVPLAPKIVGRNVRNIFASQSSDSTFIETTLGLFRVDTDNELTLVYKPAGSVSVLAAFEKGNKIALVTSEGTLLSYSLPMLKANETRVWRNKILKAWSLPSCGVLMLARESADDSQLKLYCFNGITTTESPLNELVAQAGLDPSAFGSISDIVEQDDGVLWIATDIGLVKIANSEFSLHSHIPYDKHSLSSNRLSSLLLANATLFIGTEFDGLSQHHTVNEGIEYFDLLNSSVKRNGDINLKTKNPSCGTAQANDYNTVWSILEDLQGDLWVGTNAGLAVRRKGHSNFADSSRIGAGDDGLEICAVWALAEADNRIWMGIWGGLVSLDKTSRRYVHYKPSSNEKVKSGLVGTFVRLLLHDEIRNSLWIGTNANGLNRLDLTTEKFTHYPFSDNNPEQIPHGRIRSLYLDPDNKLWVGSGGGLSLWNEADNTFKTLGASTTITDLSDESVRAINHYRDNRFWIGTGNGINLFNANTFSVEQRLHEKDGLSNSTVYAMVPDEQNRYWISTANGLNRFDPENNVFNTFNYQYGLQSNEFNFNAWHTTASGEIMLGGISGLNIIDPNTFSSHDSKPLQPVITSIVSSNENDEATVVSRFTEHNEVLTIPPSFRQLDVTYSFPHFIRTSSLYSQHQLTENNSAWSPAQTISSKASYTNIKPGHHSFQLRLNDEILYSYPIVFVPFFWESTWFLTLVTFATIATAVYLLNFFNKRRINASLDILTRQHYHILEHELSPHLKQVEINLKTLAESSTSKNKDYLYTSVNPLIEKSLHFLNNVRDIVDFEHAATQPKKSYMLEDVVDESILFFVDQRHRIINEKVADINVRTYDNALYLLLINLISNALKYSPQSEEVHLSISADADDITIVCSDNGVGISTAKREQIYKAYTRLPRESHDITGLGLGLTIVKAITQACKGQIRIEKNKPKGSRFFVTLKGVVENEEV